MSTPGNGSGTAAQNANRFHTPFGDFTLRRYPRREGETLKAWCAADTLLLAQAERLGVAGDQALVVNDAYGALCVALSPFSLWTDSALSALAMHDNVSRNGMTPVPVVWSTDPPPVCQGPVLLRIPKSLAYFEYQLERLSRTLPAGTLVIAAGMDKHLSPNTAVLMERWLGSTQRHRGQRKARLFTAHTSAPSHSGGIRPGSYYSTLLNAEVMAGPNVFSHDRLDAGSRFLLEHLAQLAPARRVLDLACGNGILGLGALYYKLAQTLVFCDESAMAIDAARHNVQLVFPAQRDACTFIHGDGVEALDAHSVDLVLLNPPFHAGNTIDDFVGRRLIQQCERVLAPGGRLLLVANRHLDYRATLQRSLPHIQQLAANAKFRLLLAHRD